MDDSHSHLVNCIQTACLLEATARKAGNVHPGASFDDLHYEDFVDAARIIAPILADASQRSVGQVILDAIVATNRHVGSNANLGIVLLIAPLAAVPMSVPLDVGIFDLLNRLTVDDARLVYEAIRLANPGGMGAADEADIHQVPTITLKAAMELAADRDSIARQYANDFEDVLRNGLKDLFYAWYENSQTGRPNRVWEQAVVELQLKLLARIPDSLITRKCGSVVSADASMRAKYVLSKPAGEERQDAYRWFDQWLRADSNRRNPGTTADLIAAILFAALRDRWIEPPCCPFPKPT